MAAMTNAEKQKAYRDRLRERMSEAEYQGYKERIATLDRRRHKRNKLFERVLKQFDEWYEAFKKHYNDEWGSQESVLSSAPLFVPETPFFKKILIEAGLNSKERRVWEILFYALSVFPKVSAGPSTFYPVMAYTMEREFVDSAIEKLIEAKAIMYQEEDCLGLVTFFRGEAWEPWNLPIEEFQASFDLGNYDYIGCYERNHCDEKHPLRRWRKEDKKATEE